MADDEFDVVIAGAGGGFAAFALTRAGLRVLLLDRGPRFDFKQDFPLRHRGWESRTDVLAAATREEDTVVRQRGARIAPEDRDICSQGVNLIGTGECVGNRRGAFHYPRVHGVGGNTLHYQGEAHRFPPHAFRPRSLLGWGEDWPIDYETLAP